MKVNMMEMREQEYIVFIIKNPNNDTDSEEEKETSYSSMEEWVSCDYSDCDEKIDQNDVGDDYNLSLIGGGYAYQVP